MYYSSGNYEAFARPRKPEGVDNKSAHIIGTGLAALTAACYLVRDGQLQGQNIHIYEKDPIPGGACDGWQYPDAKKTPDFFKRAEKAGFYPSRYLYRDKIPAL